MFLGFTGCSVSQSVRDLAKPRPIVVRAESGKREAEMVDKYRAGRSRILVAEEFLHILSDERAIDARSRWEPQAFWIFRGEKPEKGRVVGFCCFASRRRKARDRTLFGKQIDFVGLPVKKLTIFKRPSRIGKPRALRKSHFLNLPYLGEPCGACRAPASSVPPKHPQAGGGDGDRRDGCRSRYRT